MHFFKLIYILAIYYFQCIRFNLKMKIILLAAGNAKRLRPLTNDTPKCLLNVGSIPILERIIKNFLSFRLANFVIVTGFQHRKIEEFISATFPILTPLYVHNKEYETTNNAYSLYLALEASKSDDIIIADTDIVFDSRLLISLLLSPKENSLLVRQSNQLGNEEIKVVTSNDGKITSIGKGIEPANAVGESIGIAKISLRATRDLYDILLRQVKNGTGKSDWYETAFQEFINNNGTINAIVADDSPCIEIDTPEDLATAEKEIVPLLENLL